jgi:hypothetical protein
VYNWPAGTERYRKVKRFVQAFFDRLRDLQSPAYHAKWRAIDVTAPVLGRTRFGAAQDWIKAPASTAMGRPDTPERTRVTGNRRRW